MAKEHDGSVYGLHQFSFAGTIWGYISDDSIEWGGEERTTNRIWAAQKRNAPWKEITDNAGTDELEGDLIELKPANLKAALGGTVDATGKKWSAPAEIITQEGPVEILTADGAKISIPKASLVAKPKGNFGYKDVFKVHFKLTILMPDEGGAPYTIDYGSSEAAEG